MNKLYISLLIGAAGLLTGISAWMGLSTPPPQVEPLPIIHEVRMAANSTVLPLLPMPPGFGAPPLPIPEASPPAISEPEPSQPTEAPLTVAMPAPAKPAAVPVTRRRKTAVPRKAVSRKRLYGVHVESDRNRQEAIKGAQPLFDAGLLDADGVSPVLHEVRIKGDRYYRLLVGPYANKRVASAQADRVKGLTGYADVVPWPASNLAQVLRLPPESRPPEALGFDEIPKTMPSGLDAPSGAAVKPPDNTLVALSMIEGELFFDVRLKRDLIYQGMICQGRNGTLFLPLSEMFAALRFPIDITESGAEGWFIKQDRKFSFSLESGEVTTDQSTQVLDKNHYFTQENEIYVTINDFNAFFNLRVEPDIPVMELRVVPGEMLPIQLEKNRRSNHPTSSSRDTLRYPLRDLDYAAVAPPRLDAKFGIGWRKSKDEQATSGTLSGLYRGDILFMSTALYGTGTYTQPKDGDGEFKFTDASLTAERVMLDNPYLKQFSIGDITPTSTPILGGGSLERGIRVSNRNPLSTSSFDTRTFTGKGLPGWDVELYRNDTLVAFQTIGESGTYIFEDVPLNYGSNKFKLITYGTEGQEEIREEEITIGTDAIQAGSVVYDFSASQQGVGVFDSENSLVNAGLDADHGANRFKGTMSLGIKDGFILRSSVNKDSKNGKDRQAGSIGFSTGFQSFLAKMDYANSNLGTQVATASLRGTAFDGHNLNINTEHQFSDNRDDYSTKNDLSASVSKSVRLEDESNFTYSVRAQRLDSIYSSGDSSKYNLGLDLSLFADWGNISNNLNSDIYQKRIGDQEDLVSGSLTYYKTFGTTSVRGSTNYNLTSSAPVFSNFSVTGNHRFDRLLSTSLSVTKNFGDYDAATVSNQWNFNVSPYTMYLRGSANDEELYVVSAGVSTSIDFDKDLTPTLSPSGVADSGGVSCFVYKDENYNNVYDNGDEPLEGVVLKSLQSGQIATTNKDGKALFYRLSPLRPVDIELQLVSLRDPRYYYQKAGEAVMPRKGKLYHLDFPVQVAGDIEGMVYMLAHDDARGRPNIPIQLVDTDGNVVKEVTSEFDGFFVLPKVGPGTYSLRIDQEFLSKNGYTGTMDGGLEMTADGDLLSNNLLFYGEQTVVAALKDKFMVKMKADIFDKVNLAEGDLDTVPAASAPQLAEQGFAEPETTTQAGTALAVAQSEVPQTAQPAQTERRYALAIDIFTTEKSADRAVKFYTKKYGPELPNCTIDIKQAKNAFIVYIRGIQGDAALVRWANTFLVPDSVRKKSYVMR